MRSDEVTVDQSPVGTQEREPEAPGGRQPVWKQQWFTNTATRGGLLLAGVILFVGFSVAVPTFASVSSVVTMAQSQAVFILLALAVTLPMRCADFDISIGANAAFGASLLAVLSKHGLPTVLVIVLPIVAGLVIGAVNALVGVYIGINVFIVTLGTSTILAGLTYLLTNGVVISPVPDTIVSLSVGNLFGIPASVYYCFLLVAVLFFVYTWTPFGRMLNFVGGNPRSASLAGVPVGRMRTVSLIVTGGIAGFAGVILAGTLGAADPSVGPQYLLPPYAAAFLGTAAIEIGRFNAVGTLVAGYFIGIGVTGLQLLGAGPAASDIFNGVALLVAVVLAHLGYTRLSRASG